MTEYETVEAIQCVIPDIGIVLITGTPDNPPDMIFREQIEGLRVFQSVNEHGPSFHYRNCSTLAAWEFDHKVEGKPVDPEPLPEDYWETAQ